MGGKMSKIRCHGSLLITCLMLVGPLAAEQIGIAVAPESFSKRYPGKAYSPYAQRSFPGRPLWGDTHLHTGLSVDAGLFGARLGLEEAYRFARGEEVFADPEEGVAIGAWSAVP